MSEAMKCGITVVTDPGSRWPLYRDCTRPAYGYYIGKSGEIVPHCAIHFGAALSRERRKARREEEREAEKIADSSFRLAAATIAEEFGITGGRYFTYKGKHTNLITVDVDRLLAKLREASNAPAQEES